MVPLVRPHARHRSIVIDARIVHEYLNRTRLQYLRHGTWDRLGIADVEADYSGRSARSNDVISHLLSRHAVAIRMNDDMQLLLRQLSADRSADLTTATRNQGSLHTCSSRYFRKMEARPSNHARCTLVTRKTQMKLPASPTKRVA